MHGIKRSDSMFQYLWIVILGIWFSVSGFFIIKACAENKWNLHSFESDIDSLCREFETIALIVNFVLALALIWIFKLWIQAAWVWFVGGGLLLIKDIIEIRKDDDDDYELTKFSRVYIAIATITMIIVTIASLYKFVHSH